jgi:hypothetical protein
MRRTTVFLLVALMFMAVLVGPLFGQSLKGMSLNGATGLWSIPSGRIGWERTADLGFDLGYHAIIDDGETTHIPKASVSLFKIGEVSFAYDAQPGDDNEDLIIGGKIQLPIEQRSAVAVGFNLQQLQSGGVEENAQQIYLAATYPGDFFNMPAETTFVLGKSFGDSIPDEWIDFGMGFDLLLFPETLQGYVHWISDFANFSYSAQAFGADAGIRGVFNTGIRIDIAANPALSEYKFVIDVLATDLLDEARSLGLGLAFGAPIL